MTALASAFRSSRGFSAMNNLPVFTVALIVPAPTTEVTLTTSGSRSTISEIVRWRSSIARNEIDCAASVTPTINPVSCWGSSPFGTTMYSKRVATRVAIATASVKN